ncbi:hypothetical protein BDY19DRAFT_988325 [Irpex rosettiformis]|uniref:Uncharacterized protein n=1 Tax=Irpex rosettiformis TaxID=378272 RepID=A0ACB8UJD9_9APHY|nr:hypothetical protein BDY19DRAFT_988325 [Irpex rosettiformis]
MRGQPSYAPDNEPSETGLSMKEMWAEAAREFEKICGESLQDGEVKNFDDLQKRIENAGKATYVDGQEDKWKKAKSVGLTSLKYLKMLVDAASKASAFIPIPASATDITSNALCFVFDIPNAIKGYNDAIDEVFSQVSSALSQFQIYRSMDADNVNRRLIKQIQLVMISFVKICAYVVKFRQGHLKVRVTQRVKSIFGDDSGLSDAMDEFKRTLQQQRDVEGTITLAIVVQTHQAVQETQKGVQAINDSSNRKEMLIKIRNTLGVPSTVRLDSNTTQTCTNIFDRCLDDTGTWLWAHDAYTAWTAREGAAPVIPNSHALLVSGTPSSGKTSVSALITKRLEKEEGRVYVAHYFFPSNTKKSDDEKNPVPLALKYMAFQIARVDATVLMALGKVCNTSGVSRRLASAGRDSLDALWGELKIGTSASRAIYYLVFDGLENLTEEQAEMLLAFIFGPKLANESTGRVRVFASGTGDLFTELLASGNISAPLQIRMNECNEPDICLVIERELDKHGILQHTNSKQQLVREKIIQKLPSNVQGNYSLLQIGLDNVIRLLRMRSTVQELDRILDQPLNSHETTIKDLQRSLTEAEVSELNELLKWVLFCKEVLTLDQLEAIMFLCSGIESLASMEDIIKAKYSAVLKVEGNLVSGQDGVEEYFQEKEGISARSSHSKHHSTISMTITINNVDQERCSRFLWNLAQKGVLENFEFEKSATGNSIHGAIAVDEFDAHHTIVKRAFKYLSKERESQTSPIGRYLVCWLPYHLGRLHELEDEEKGELTVYEKFDIGQNLYTLFYNEEVFHRHMASFEQTLWYADEMNHIQKWLTDSVAVRRLDRAWRDEVQLAASPTGGYLKVWVRTVVEGFLKNRSWSVLCAYYWIAEFMKADNKKLHRPQSTSSTNSDNHATSSDSSSSYAEPNTEIDWDLVSVWCQKFLGLPDSELTSFWYERLASASFYLGNTSGTTISLWQRAIKKDNPSWCCYGGLGNVQCAQGQVEEGIAQVELALQEAEQEGSVPKPETADIVGLYLLLRRYAHYTVREVQEKVEHYLAACESEDIEQARQARLSHLIGSLLLGSSDEETMRESLKITLGWEGGRDGIITVLKTLARYSSHDILMLKLFTIANREPDLLRDVMCVLETATEDHTTEMTEDTHFAEDEYRGVLLYNLGIATYIYQVSPSGNEPTSEALRLWHESLSKLSNVGGRNAYLTQNAVTSALAKHYFQSMRDDDQLNDFEVLTRMADTGFYGDFSDAGRFLGILYALRNEKLRARGVLSSRVGMALQILSDDTPENDTYGFSILHEMHEAYQDLKNSAIALSFVGQPDLVTNALTCFVAEDIDDDKEGLDKQRVLRTVNDLARETVKIVKSQIPEAKQQIQRIEAAKAHVDSLATAVTPEASSGDDEADNSESHTMEDPMIAADLETATAYHLLQSRLSDLYQKHTPKLDGASFQWGWTCDGRSADGNPCPNKSDFEHPFYHCTFCANKDFCADCLARLRDPTADIKIISCSSKHRWLKLPPQGDDMYVGSRAKSVRVPQEVRAMDGDEQILEIIYAEDGSGEEIAVEKWMEDLAREWKIDIEEIREQ